MSSDKLYAGTVGTIVLNAPAIALDSPRRVVIKYVVNKALEGASFRPGIADPYTTDTPIVTLLNTNLGEQWATQDHGVTWQRIR